MRLFFRVEIFPGGWVVISALLGLVGLGGGSSSIGVGVSTQATSASTSGGDTGFGTVTYPGGSTGLSVTTLAIIGGVIAIVLLFFFRKKRR